MEEDILGSKYIDITSIDRGLKAEIKPFVNVHEVIAQVRFQLQKILKSLNYNISFTTSYVKQDNSATVLFTIRKEARIND